MTKYGLNIVFNMKTYSQLQLEGTTSEFKYGDLKFELTKLSDVDNSYSLIVKPINDLNQAKYILGKVKLALTLFVLENNNFVAIEIDENIKNAYIFEEPILVENDLLLYGKYNTNETTLFPLGVVLEHANSAFAEFITLSKIDKFTENIENAFSLNHENIYNDEKLSLSLEMYSQHSQFSRKRQFLDLVTILEILKPEYSVSDESLNTIDVIKNEMKNARKKFKKDSDEYKEFDRYFHDLHFWKTKSINKSLQKFAKEYQRYFVEFENIDAKVKRVYEIRSNIVHYGVIDDEFDEYFDFLKSFVGKLLKIMIEIVNADDLCKDKQNI